MATPQEIAAWAAGAEARGVVPHRPIGPPDWQAKGSTLAFMLGQGFSNEHNGRMPNDDAEFHAWVDAPTFADPALRRHNASGSPWDWQPAGCPGGAGCNDQDWMNHAPWPSPNGAGGGGGGAPTGAATPVPVAVVSTPVGPIGTAGGALVLPGIGAVSPLVLGAAAVGVVLILSRRR